MNIDSWVASLALTYGVTDRLDITAGLPFVHTSVEGSNEFIDYAIAPAEYPWAASTPPASRLRAAST